ncbi:MAG TPA: M56 family metallopeptidase, partial [Planctomycetaceae bacterium]|nr:M56 family metallopeptidase [Planctomycetaceae bacterium]
MKTLIVSITTVFLALAPATIAPGIISSQSMPPWVEQLGWTILHSLWQIGLIALLAASACRLLRRNSAKARYAVLGATMAMMAAAPIVTVLILPSPERRMDFFQESERPGASRRFVPDSTGPTPAASAWPLTGSTHGDDNVAANTASSMVQDSPSQTKVRALSAPNLAAEISPQATPRFSLRDRLSNLLHPRLPLLVGFWFAGVLICSMRPVWSVWEQSRLRQTGLSPVPDSVQQMLELLIQRMRLNRIVRIAESTLVKVPLVVGYLRPMILLPASVLTGLTPSQLEAVLAHELAHVRRHDWLINALQVLVETLLFYHPAIWWLSLRIRHERELCCDDIALGLNVDKAVYARMLLTLEELQQKSLTPGFAATGGHLAARVRRLLPRPESIQTSSHPASLTGLLTMAISLVLLLTVVVLQSQTAPAEPIGAASVQVIPQDESKPETPANDPAATPAEEAALVSNKDDNPATPGLRRRTVKVVDEKEQPITGAEIRFQFEHRSPQGNRLDGLLTETTDAKGEITIEAPVNSEEVVLSVKAEGFGEFSETQSATGSSTVHMKRGRFIHVRAVDEAGDILSKAVPLLEGDRIWGREFVPQKDDTFKSPAVAMTRRLMRVVSAQENGPFLFSDLIDVETAQVGDDGVMQLVLKPGTKLTGRLDDAVPRPITEGYVQLTVVEGTDHKFTMDPSDNKLQKNEWTWEDSTPVQPDGTFTFQQPALLLGIALGISFNMG